MTRSCAGWHPQRWVCGEASCDIAQGFGRPQACVCNSRSNAAALPLSLGQSRHGCRSIEVVVTRPGQLARCDRWNAVLHVMCSIRANTNRGSRCRMLWAECHQSPACCAAGRAARCCPAGVPRGDRHLLAGPLVHRCYDWRLAAVPPHMRASLRPDGRQAPPRTGPLHG